MFLLPGPGSTYKNPLVIRRQLISGLHVDGFYISNIETSWFTSLQDLAGLFLAPSNQALPPILSFHPICELAVRDIDTIAVNLHHDEKAVWRSPPK